MQHNIRSCSSSAWHTLLLHMSVQAHQQAHLVHHHQHVYVWWWATQKACSKLHPPGNSSAVSDSKDDCCCLYPWSNCFLCHVWFILLAPYRHTVFAAAVVQWCCRAVSMLSNGYCSIVHSVNSIHWSFRRFTPGVVAYIACWHCYFLLITAIRHDLKSRLRGAATCNCKKHFGGFSKQVVAAPGGSIVSAESLNTQHEHCSIWCLSQQGNLDMHTWAAMLHGNLTQQL